MHRHTPVHMYVHNHLPPGVFDPISRNSSTIKVIAWVAISWPTHAWRMNRALLMLSSDWQGSLSNTHSPKIHQVLAHTYIISGLCPPRFILYTTLRWVIFKLYIHNYFYFTLVHFTHSGKICPFIPAIFTPIHHFTYIPISCVFYLYPVFTSVYNIHPYFNHILLTPPNSHQSFLNMSYLHPRVTISYLHYFTPQLHKNHYFTLSYLHT